MESGPGVTDHPGSLRIGLQDSQTILMATKIMYNSIGSLLDGGMIWMWVRIEDLSASLLVKIIRSDK